MNRWLKSFVTLSLAAFYALISSCGHALHCHDVNCHGVSCKATCCGEIACCVDCPSDTTATKKARQTCTGHNHFAEIRVALGDSGYHEKSSSTAGDCSYQISPADQSFSLDDCVACQLLSQIEVGFALSDSHAGAWLNQCHPPILDESPTTESFARSFDARGPPTWC